MVWWQNRNDDDLPPELRGKKPEELAALIRKAGELETALAAEKTERDALKTKLDSTTSEFDTIKTKLAEIEAKTTPITTATTTTVDDEPASPWVDPQKFVQDQTKPLAQVALASGMLTAKMYFVQQLSERDQKIFKKYASEVEQGVSTFAPEARVMPQAWLNCFLFVKGAHEQDIRKAETEKTDFFAETASRTGGTQDVGEPEDKLTAEEEETCRVMHWDPKGYLERKKASHLTSHSKGASLHYGIPKPTIAR
jgi:hypothetical protein